MEVAAGGRAAIELAVGGMAATQLAAGLSCSHMPPAATLCAVCFLLCAVCLNTRRPSIMVGPLDGHKPIAVHTGQKLTLVACESFGAPPATHEGGHVVVPIMLELLCEVVKPGTLMLLDEGSIQLQVQQQGCLPCLGLLMRCCIPCTAPAGDAQAVDRPRTKC